MGVICTSQRAYRKLSPAQTTGPGTLIIQLIVLAVIGFTHQSGFWFVCTNSLFHSAALLFLLYSEFEFKPFQRDGSHIGLLPIAGKNQKDDARDTAWLLPMILCTQSQQKIITQGAKWSMRSFKVEFHGFEWIHTKQVINITSCLLFSNVFRKVQVQIIF